MDWKGIIEMYNKPPKWVYIIRPYGNSFDSDMLQVRYQVFGSKEAAEHCLRFFQFQKVDEENEIWEKNPDSSVLRKFVIYKTSIIE